MPTETITVSECAAFLRTRDNFLILTHLRPDGDTIGCAAALCVALRDIGKTAHILRNAEVTPLFEPLVEDYYAPDGEYGTIVTVDMASELTMMLKGGDPYVGRVDLSIDHHPSNTGYAKRTLVDGSRAACGEIVLDVITALNTALIPEIVTAIYVAVSTDTGCFSYNNTNAGSFRAAAICAEHGADVAELNRRLFREKTRGRLAIEGHVLSTIEFAHDGRAAFVVITNADIERCGATEDDLNDIASLASGIKGVVVAATIRELDGTESCKVSLRSKPEFDSNALAQRFGGGGHRAAAGFTRRVAAVQLRDELYAAIGEALDA
jgi:phosphoesterase RecJ-like protein